VIKVRRKRKRMADRKLTSRPSERLFANDQRVLFEKSYEEQIKLFLKNHTIEAL